MIGGMKATLSDRLKIAMVWFKILIKQLKSLQPNEVINEAYKTVKINEDTSVDILEPIEIGSRVGEGEFAVVYKGKWLGADVALKCLKNSTALSFDQELQNLKYYTNSIETHHLEL